MLNIKEVNQCSNISETRVFVQDEILNEEYYSQLLESFPYDEMQRKDIHNKVAFNDYNSEAINTFLNSNKCWKDFVEYFFSG